MHLPEKGVRPAGKSTEGLPTKGYLSILSAATLWGLLPIVNRFLFATGIDPLSVAAFRATTAAVVFWLVSLLANRRALRVDPRDALFFATYGLFAVVGLHCFYALSTRLVPVPMAAILLYTAPGFVIVLSKIVFGERLTVFRLVAAATVFTGCFLVVKAYDRASLAPNLTGVLYGLGSGVSYAMLSILGKAGLRKYSSWTLMTYALLAGTLVIWLVRPPWVLLSRSYTISQWLGFAALGVVCTVLPNTLYVRGLATVEVGTASIVATFEPVVASLASLVVFGEALELPQVVGAVLVLAGAALPVVMPAQGRRGDDRRE